MKKAALCFGMMVSAGLLAGTGAYAANAEMKTFTMSFDDSWTIMDNSQTDYRIVLQQMDGEEEKGKVSIGVYQESINGYRSTLRSYKADLYELAENQAYTMYDIAGCSCYKNERSESHIDYVGRMTDKGATLYISIDGADKAEGLDQLLEGIDITLEDTGNVDYPWFWEGERFQTGSYEVKTEHLDLQSEMLPFEDPMEIVAGYSSRIAKAGDTIFVLKDETLLRCTEEDGILKVEQTYDFEDSYTELQGCDNGYVYLSGFSSYAPLLAFDEAGEMTQIPCATYYGSMHPSGDWGISFFTGTTAIPFEITDGEAIVGENLTLPEDLKSVSRVAVSEDHIFLTGTTVEKENHAVFVCNLDGKEQFKLGDVEMKEDGFIAYVYAIAETDAGIVGFDGNMKTIVFWDKEGNWLDTISGRDLFGTNYAWMTGCTVEKDGSILVSMKQERDDHSGDEVLVYRLKGFESGAQITAETDQENVEENTEEAVKATTNESTPRKLLNMKDAETVKKVQKALNDAGFDCGTVDGMPGAKTYGALNAFQEAKGFPVENEVTEEVALALGL